MKNYLFYLVSIFFGNHCFCQGNDTLISKTELTDAEFTKAKEGYLRMSKSDLYLQNDAFIHALVRKIQTNKRIENWDFLDTDESFKKWITDNLSFTGFKSVEEAIELRKKGLDSQKKLNEENSETLSLLERASSAQARIILEPDFKSAREQQGK